jgi:hypothetical protein
MKIGFKRLLTIGGHLMPLPKQGILASIVINTPAKPRFTLVKPLKSCGFFIARKKILKAVQPTVVGGIRP